jgi:hypothetical protein
MGERTMGGQRIDLGRLPQLVVYVNLQALGNPFKGSSSGGCVQNLQAPGNSFLGDGYAWVYAILG